MNVYILCQYPSGCFKGCGVYCLSDSHVVHVHSFCFFLTADPYTKCSMAHSLNVDWGFILVSTTVEREQGCINSWFKCLHWHWFDVWLQEDYFNWCHHLSLSQDINIYEDVNELECRMCLEKVWMKSPAEVERTISSNLQGLRQEIRKAKE
jgi:hypothetical protein